MSSIRTTERWFMPPRRGMNKRAWQNAFAGTFGLVALAAAIVLVAGLATRAQAEVSGDQIQLKKGDIRAESLEKDISNILVADEKIVKVIRDTKEPKFIRIIGQSAGTTACHITFNDGSSRTLQIEVEDGISVTNVDILVLHYSEILAEHAPLARVERFGPKGGSDTIVLKGRYSEGRQEVAVKQIKEDAQRNNIKVMDLTEKIVAEKPPEKPLRNVIIETRLYLISDKDMRNFGFQYNNMTWNATGTANYIVGRQWSTGNPETSSQSGQASAAGQAQTGGTVNYSKILNDSKQLDYQRLTVVEGKEAEKIFGGTTYLQNTTQNTSTYTPVNFGTILKASPKVLDDRLCELHLMVESSFPPTNPQLPTVMKDMTDQTVIIEFGQPLLLANTFKNFRSKQIDKVTGLGELPILGELFKNRSFQSGKEEALLVVTAYLQTGTMPTPDIPESLRNLQKEQTIKPPVPASGAAAAAPSGS